MAYRPSPFVATRPTETMSKGEGDSGSARHAECGSGAGRRAEMGSSNRLKLGLFGANCSSGRAVTMVPERWSGSWLDCVRLAQMADRSGIEFMLPIGRWKGYGGATDYQGATFETVTWACGLLAKTERLIVFGTVHAPLIPPLIAAKEFVTADHIGEGRFGLNVVCGWNEGEFEMFGVTLRDHETRYDYAQEWLDVIKLAWSPRENFDFAGQLIKVKGGRAKPKTLGLVASSPNGSPGASASTVNSTMLMPMRLGTAISKRLSRYRPTARCSCVARSCLAVPIFEVPECVVPTVQRRPELVRHRRHHWAMHDRDDHGISHYQVVHGDKQGRTLDRIELALGCAIRSVVLVTAPARNIAALPFVLLRSNLPGDERSHDKPGIRLAHPYVVHLHI